MSIRSQRKHATPLSAKIIDSLSRTTGMSDAELCNLLNIPRARGAQIRYLLYRQGLVKYAGNRKSGKKIVKLWKCDAPSTLRSSETSYQPPEINFAINSDAESMEIYDKLTWISKVFKNFPEIVDRIIPAEKKSKFLLAVSEIEHVLNHPFNHLLS